jgi:prepilin-type N-terminal cleavage/methylation domain-containing protein
MTTITLQGRRQRGFSLVETAIAIAVIAIAAFGSLAYQYLAEKHLKIARAEFAATRIGEMVVEDWKSQGGAANYDTTLLPTGFGFNGTYPNYTVAVDGITFHISLASVNLVNPPDFYAGTMYQLSATVRYRYDFGADAPGANDPILFFTTYSR